MDNNVQLIVWESPLLHDKDENHPPVRVAYGSDEYDFWYVAEDGDLCIGKYDSYEDEETRQQVRYERILFRIRSNMWAKVQECYSPIPTPTEEDRVHAPVFVETAKAVDIIISTQNQQEQPNDNVRQLDPERMTARQRFERGMETGTVVISIPTQSQSDFRKEEPKNDSPGLSGLIIADSDK